MKRVVITYGGYFERFIAMLSYKELHKLNYIISLLETLDRRRHTMQTNDHKIRNYSEVLAAQYGAHGTPERSKFDEEAYTFYSAQVLLDARKNAKITQSELAERIGTDKSYISRIEKGVTVPSVATFYRIASALGYAVELTPC